MNITKTVSTIGIGAAIVAGSMMAVNLASAHGGSTEQQAERVSELAERFDLDESEVQTYFEEKQDERQAERETARAEQLASLVEAGTLTQEQADELATMKDALQAEVKTLKESDAERDVIKTVMQEGRAKIKAWAEAQGIDLNDIRPENSEGRKGHRGGHGPMGDESDSSVDETVTES